MNTTPPPRTQNSEPTLPLAMHVHFWADIRNSAGSVEKVISAFATHGKSFHHRIVCFSGRHESLVPYEHRGILVLPFPESHWRNRLLNKILGLDAFTYPALVELILQERPQLIHFHNRQERVDDVLKRLDYRPAVVVHYHRHFKTPVIPKYADMLVFPSAATERYIRQSTNTQKSGQVVFNPLSLDVLEHSRQAIQAIQAIPEAHNPVPVILFGGGASPIKGIQELITAFHQLPRGSARLVLAGRGAERLSVNHPDIEVIGELSAADFFDRMSRVDIVTMPSYDESFGLIAQEAMLLGKLLVVSNSGGLAEFTGEDCAIIVPPRNADALFEGLSFALQALKDGRAKTLVLNARQRVSHLLPDNVISDLESAYQAALSTVKA